MGEDGSCERKLLTRACPQAAYRTSRLPISSGQRVSVDAAPEHPERLFKILKIEGLSYL